MTTSKILRVLLIFWPLYEISGADLPSGYVIYWGYVAESAPQPSTGVVTIGGQVLSNAVAVSAGYKHGVALRDDGTVVGWGLDSRGQATGVKTVNPDVTNGLVVIDGNVLTNFTAVATGSHFSLGLRQDGSVAGWGDDQFGQSAVPPGLSDIVAIAAGGRNICLALKSDGTVLGWGHVKVPQCLSNIVAIAGGGTWGGFGGPGGNGLALKGDGTVMQWDTRSGETTETPTNLSNVVAVAAGGTFSLALKKDRTLTGWGNISVPSELGNVVAIAAGGTHGLALKSDGTIQGIGNIDFKPVAIPTGLSNVVAIATGDGFSLAITTNRAVANRFLH